MDKWMKDISIICVRMGVMFVAVYFLKPFRIVQFLHFCFNKILCFEVDD